MYPDLNNLENNPEYIAFQKQSKTSYTCNSQQFRLVEIQKMRDTVEAKIKHNEAKSKRYKSQTIATEYINAGLSTVSVLTGSSAAITAIPVITVPLIAVPLGVVSAVAGISSGIILAVSRNRRRKMQLINKQLVKEKSTYNAILNYISKAINDSFITDDEFSYISKLCEQSTEEHNDKNNANNNNNNNDINLLASEIAAVIAAHANSLSAASRTNNIKK